MADKNNKANINEGYLSNQVYSGVVQLAFPSFGWALVIPAGATVDKAILCRLPSGGGPLGASMISAPTTGSLVTYRRQKGTDKGYIISFNPQGTESRAPAKSIMLHNYPNMPGVSFTLTTDNLAQYVETITQGKQAATYIGGQQDQYEGDIYIGDKYGPGIFTGRALLTVKGSDMSYIEMNSLQDKITTVTTASQLFTLSDKKSVTVSLNKDLKAANAYQGMGGRPWQSDPLIQKDEKLQIKLKQDLQAPLYRFQQFNGGAAKGISTSIISPIQGQEKAQPVIVSDTTTYDGLHMLMSVQGQTNIKTAFATGLVENSMPDITTTEGEDEVILNERKQTAEELLKKFEKIKLSDNGLQRTAQMDAILNKDARALIADMLGPDVLELINNEVNPFEEPYGWNVLDWQGDENPTIAQTFGEHQTAYTQDEFTKKTVRRFKNNSIITQDPDGTITLKDGWGSQITMSHGNIYISSALDTFIRPGRDLIALVPRHLSNTANGEVEIASKKHIKVGAEKNLVLASAINGEEGFTVLENRTAKKSGKAGMVIRSNGNLSVTASDDIHIGSNDKRDKNEDSKANEGQGSVFIEGQKVRVESRGELRLLGEITGLYACNKSGGTGLQLNTSSLTAIAPTVNVDTGAFFAGKFQTAYTINTGANGDVPVVLSKGGQSFTAQIRGNLQVQGAIIGNKQIQVRGMCAAGDYMVLQTTPVRLITGTRQSGIKAFKRMLSKTFGSPLNAPNLPFVTVLQKWYNDAYICSNELKFKNDWTVSTMPTMCWQLQETAGKAPYKMLERIQTHPTGDQKTITCSYPGSFGWDSCKMFTLQAQSFAPKYETNISTGYTTYTQKEN